MPIVIRYTCPSNITSFSQCNFPEGVTHVYCQNNRIKSFQYLPGSVSVIFCENNQINSFQYLPGSVTHIFCSNNQIDSFKYLLRSVIVIECDINQINSFQYLPDTVSWIYCENNQINSFQYLPDTVSIIHCNNNRIDSFKYLPRSVTEIACMNNPCHAEYISKRLRQIHNENIDRNIDNWISGISKLQYIRLNYMVHTLWKRYWYDQRDTQGYSRACKHLASKNCPNGFLIMTPNLNNIL